MRWFALAGNCCSGRELLLWQAIVSPNIILKLQQEDLCLVAQKAAKIEEKITFEGTDYTGHIIYITHIINGSRISFIQET